MSMRRDKKAAYKNKYLVLFISLIVVFGISEYAIIQNEKIEKPEEVIEVIENDNKSEVQEEENENNSEIIEKNDDENKSNSELQIYFFDVGQADCILLMCDSQNMLIDAGNNPDGKLIVNYLKNELNINKIDYLVGTHPHEDHIGGLDDIIESFDVNNIYMPKKAVTTRTFEEVLDALTQKELKVKSVKVGDTFNVGSAKCEIMSIEDDAEEVNEASIVIEVTYGNEKYLFTGDAEVANEEKRRWNDIDVLKVAHHGSNTSSSIEFLNQTKPEIAIISVGKDNSYHHPHEVTLDKLSEIKSEIYRTDLDGTILLTSDGKTNIIEKLKVSLDGNI